MPNIPGDVGAAIQLPRGLGKSTVGAPVSLVFPWWERPTNQSLDFQTQQVPAVLAAAVGATLLVTSFEVFAGYNWVLRGVNLFVDAPAPTFNVIWAVRFRQAPLFTPLRFAGRTLANLEIPYAFARRGVGPGILDILATNQAATGPWTIAASLSGWATPDTEAQMTYPANISALG